MSFIIMYGSFSLINVFNPRRADLKEFIILYFIVEEIEGQRIQINIDGSIHSKM